MTEHEIFVHSLELSDPNSRKEYVDRSCGDDRRLWQRVNDLLDAHDRASGFLQTPVLKAVPKEDTDAIEEKPGTVIGPYKLLQLIGEGGFGVVYMAEQTEPMRRKVALKVIKPGMDTKAVVARFDSERQALALMEHPNIARVLDAGTTATGRPYFVMELVKGVPITEFCDKNNLPIEQRLQLFMEVCRAVQHAHHKGVIHRDLKPSNVMVTLHDGRPVPKVIDFGVAKATSQQLTQGTLFTAYGQMIGTPVYMSPEQAEMSGLDIDTRSDIYSLGVLLYELLTGTTPLEIQKLREAGLVEMQRLIREEETLRPSMRLSTLGERATVLANQRGTDAKRLSQFLSGDLDWIVMKSLEKDRRRRYDTPNDFAADVQRFLHHEAIVARPPSAVYRLRKFCSRNRRTVAAFAALATALLVGTVASTWQAIRATNAEHQALNARAAEAQQRAAAVKERDEAQRLQRETQSLNDQLKQAASEQRRAIYATEMNLVRIEAQRGNLQRMRELLMQQLPTKGDEDLRGFEWSYWYRFLNQAQVLKRFEGFRYGQRGSALAIVPGGQIVAITRGNKTEFQDLPSGDVVGTAPFQLRLFVNRTRLAFNGRAVVSPANSPSAFWLGNSEPVRPAGVSVYEPSGDKKTFEFPDQTIGHNSFTEVSRDGRFVAALGNDVTHEREKPACRLLVWNVESGELVLNRLEHRELNRMEFSRDGNRLAAYVCHSTKRHSDVMREVAIVFDIPSGDVQGVAHHNDDVDCVFWLPEGDRLLMSTLGYSGSSRKELLTWSLYEEVPRRLTNEYMPDYVKGDISPDGRLFAVSGHTVSAIRLIDTTSGQIVRTLHNEATSIDTLTFSNDGEHLVACSTSGEVLRWDLGHQDDLFKLRSNPLKNVRYLTHAVSEDLSLVAVANLDGNIHVRTRDGQETLLHATPTQPSNTYPTLLFSPDTDDWCFLKAEELVAPGTRLWKCTT
jgi:serine/threonine protein kinase